MNEMPKHLQWRSAAEIVEAREPGWFWAGYGLDRLYMVEIGFSFDRHDSMDVDCPTWGRNDIYKHRFTRFAGPMPHPYGPYPERD